MLAQDSISAFQNSIYSIFNNIGIPRNHFYLVAQCWEALRDETKTAARKFREHYLWGHPGEQIKTRFSYPGCRFPFSKYNKVKKKSSNLGKV